MVIKCHELGLTSDDVRLISDVELLKHHYAELQVIVEVMKARLMILEDLDQPSNKGHISKLTFYKALLKLIGKRIAELEGRYSYEELLKAVKRAEYFETRCASLLEKEEKRKRRESLQNLKIKYLMSELEKHVNKFDIIVKLEEIETALSVKAEDV